LAATYVVTKNDIFCSVYRCPTLTLLIILNYVIFKIIIGVSMSVSVPCPVSVLHRFTPTNQESLKSTNSFKNYIIRTKIPTNLD
jgi:hypothetical protein